MIRPLLRDLPHISGRPPKAAVRYDRTYTVRVGPAATPWSLQRVLTLCGTGFGLNYRQATTISVLPDNVLLEMFFFYKETNGTLHLPWGWHLFAHICRRWRQVVFGSPVRLDLRIFCTSRTPVGKNLGIWPALPILIDFNYYSNRRNSNTTSNEDNIITALKHVDRVCDIRLSPTGSELEKISTAMQEPFPVLTSLYIASDDGNAPVLPAEFLGGSAPCLRNINLSGIPFPAIPTLLLSTSDLVSLELYNIPQSGFISPEAMVVGLAALPRLKGFVMDFRSATPPPYRHPPATRTVLPALTNFLFQGASEYLEDLVSRIDVPQLNRIHISYLNQLTEFRVDQLPMFIYRSVGPKLTHSVYAQVSFFSDHVTFHVYRHPNDSSPEHHHAITTVLCQGIDWQVSHIAQVLSHMSATLSNVVHLKLDLEVNCQLEGTDDVEWLHFFDQFSTVKTLQVSYELAGHVALALEDIAWETVAEVLPSLDLIYLAGQPVSSIEKFVAARRLSDRPITVVETQTAFDEKLGSYVSI